jgi:hypothetical protein
MTNKFFLYIYLSHIKPSYYVTVADRAEGLLATFDTVPAKRNVVAEAYTTQPNSKASSRVLYMYFSCMAG